MSGVPPAGVGLPEAPDGDEDQGVNARGENSHAIVKTEDAGSAPGGEHGSTEVKFEDTGAPQEASTN